MTVIVPSKTLNTAAPSIFNSHKRPLSRHFPCPLWHLESYQSPGLSGASCLRVALEMMSIFLSPVRAPSLSEEFQAWSVHVWGELNSPAAREEFTGRPRVKTSARKYIYCSVFVRIYSRIFRVVWQFCDSVHVLTLFYPGSMVQVSREREWV